MFAMHWWLKCGEAGDDMVLIPIGGYDPAFPMYMCRTFRVI